MDQYRKMDQFRRKPVRNQGVITWAVLLLVGLMISLRTVALDSDPYPSLSWSSALLTDEGFYIHNARNIVLFGHASTDQFNNMLIMPLLHFVQVFVFSHWGVGAIQARAISVTSSLFSFPVLFIAVDRSLGRRTAVYATLFLGLDHVYLLYNRMALMDTPAACLLILLFWAWVEAHRARQLQRAMGLYLCGVLLGVAYGVRALVAPLCIISIGILCSRLAADIRCRASTTQIRAHGLDLFAHLCGLLCFGLAYYFAWYHPNHAELIRVNRYYSAQLIPDGIAGVGHNLFLAVLGDNRGVSPYLIRHTPVQFGLALTWILILLPRSSVWCRGKGSETSLENLNSLRAGEAGKKRLVEKAALGLIIGWLLILWLILMVSDYAPSRYYVLFYPAMAILSAHALSRWRFLKQQLPGRLWVSGVISGLFCYHLVQAVSMRLIANTAFHLSPAVQISRGEIAPLLSFGAGVVLGIGIPLRLKRVLCMRNSPPQRYLLNSKRVPLMILFVWSLIDIGWTGNWLTHLTYRQKSADAWLALHLPANSVLIGAVAPGLCLNNHLVAVNVIQGLCNDHHPVEAFAPSPCYILILDDNWREIWWLDNYPLLMNRKRRMMVFAHLLRPRFNVGVYPAND